MNSIWPLSISGNRNWSSLSWYTVQYRVIWCSIHSAALSLLLYTALSQSCFISFSLLFYYHSTFIFYSTTAILLVLLLYYYCYVLSLAIRWLMPSAISSPSHWPEISGPEQLQIKPVAPPDWSVVFPVLFRWLGNSRSVLFRLRLSVIGLQSRGRRTLRSNR